MTMSCCFMLSIFVIIVILMLLLIALVIVIFLFHQDLKEIKRQYDRDCL